MLTGYCYYLAICHFITYVVILTFCILFPLTKFCSLCLMLQHHILTLLNFWDVLRNLVCFGYAGLILLCTFAYDLLCNALSHIIDNFPQWKSHCFIIEHNKQPSHKVILPCFSQNRRSWIY